MMPIVYVSIWSIDNRNKILGKLLNDKTCAVHTATFYRLLRYNKWNSETIVC